MSPTLSIPVAPKTTEELYNKYGVFAVLVPNSQESAHGFSDLVDQLMLTPTLHQEILSQSCLFLFGEDRRSLEDILDVGATPFLPLPNRKANNSDVADSDDVANASDTTCGSAHTNTSAQLWHGFVGISLKKRPQAAMLGGWFLGFQPVLFAYAPPGRCPDIPICSESRGRMAGIHRHHVLIGCVRGSGILGMKAVKRHARAKCDARPVSTEMQKPLADPTHLIEFGTLQYWMVYLQLRGAVDEARRRDMMEFINGMPGGNAVRSATATPTDRDTVVGMWRILGEAGRGISNVMAAAIHKQSGIVAVSRYRQKGALDYRIFCNELDVEQSTTNELSRTRFGRCHIQRLLETSDYGECRYAFYAPLCPWSLGTLLKEEDYTDLERQILFTQLLLAVRDLHAIQRIHNDIKPKNICVQSRHPLCLVLVDTASIQYCPASGLPCIPGGGGTVGYLAPEREASSTYGKPADIWAAACVGVEMLLRKGNFTARYLTVWNGHELCNPWRDLHTFPAGRAPRVEDVEGVQSSFHRFRNGLKEHAHNSAEYLLYLMLETDPRKRTTAQAALLHPYALERYDEASEASCQAQLGTKRKASGP
ncbi:hypothetical protein AC579_7594 [Pseudocercospora musae]|uniref:Protein kinase domain-containing protein n=1 Tax=Pseudocercospora musae TaxID=113226 RepID=A0A139H3M6_9PEZI|nr:hypothetical protein AC579_7594 [Pseudocercospora musae]